MRNSFDRPSGVEFQGKWRWNDAKSNSFAGQPCDTLAKFDRNKPHTTPLINRLIASSIILFSLFSFCFAFFNTFLEFNFAKLCKLFVIMGKRISSCTQLSIVHESFCYTTLTLKSLEDEDVFSPASREPSMAPKEATRFARLNQFSFLLVRSSTWWDCNLILRVTCFPISFFYRLEFIICYLITSKVLGEEC